MSQEPSLHLVSTNEIAAHKRKKRSQAQRAKKRARADWKRIFLEGLAEHGRLVEESKGPASVSGLVVLYAGQDGRFGRWFAFSDGRVRLALLAACEMLRAEILDLMREDVRPRESQS